MQHRFLAAEVEVHRSLGEAGGARDLLEVGGAKALRDEPRQVSAMVKMRVGQHNRVDLGRWNWKGLPVPFAQFLQTLKEARVNEDPG